jgi:hypothetical protein
MWAYEDEVTGECRKRHNEELSDLYSSSNTVPFIKLRIMGWERNVANMGERRDVTGLWWENLEEIDHLEDPGVDEIIIL